MDAPRVEIVTQLRSYQHATNIRGETRQMAQRAADEIDQLRADYARISEGHDLLHNERDDLRDEIERLRSYIWSLDGKHIGISADNGATFIDDGIIVATDILGSDHEQKADSDG